MKMNRLFHFTVSGWGIRPSFHVSQVVSWISSINSISPINHDIIPPIAPNSLKCQALCGVRSPLIFTKLVGGISSISTSSAHKSHLKKPPCSIYLHTLDKIFKQGTITSPWEKENHQKCREKRIYCSYEPNWSKVGTKNATLHMNDPPILGTFAQENLQKTVKADDVWSWNGHFWSCLY